MKKPIGGESLKDWMAGASLALAANNGSYRPLFEGEDPSNITLSRDQARELRRRQAMLWDKLTVLVKTYNTYLDMRKSEAMNLSEFNRLDMEYKDWLRKNESLFLYENLSNNFTQKVDVLLEIRKLTLSKHKTGNNVQSDS